MNGVTVRKWYLDCVTDAGDAAIVYAGRVTLGPMPVPYLELLSAQASAPPAHLRRVSGRARVTETNADLTLEAAPLRITGRWTPRHAPIDASLLDDARGGLDRRWVWVDGTAVDASVVDRDRVVWPGASVEMAPGRVVRHGRIGTAVAGALAACLPRRVSQAVETKWVSQAVLHDDRGAAETG